MVSARTNGEYEQRALRPPKAGESPSEPSVAVAGGGRTHTGARPQLQRPRARDRAKGTHHGEQHRRSMKLPVYGETTTEVRR